MGAVSWLLSLPVSEALARWIQIVRLSRGKKNSQEKKATPVYETLSDSRLQQRAAILSQLHKHPVSSFMNSFFRTLAQGSPDWGVASFIEGAKRFASLTDLTGLERAECLATRCWAFTLRAPFRNSGIQHIPISQLLSGISNSDANVPLAGQLNWKMASGY